MSILHSYHPHSKPMISVENVYEKSPITLDVCYDVFQTGDRSPLGGSSD